MIYISTFNNWKTDEYETIFLSSKIPFLINNFSFFNAWKNNIFNLSKEANNELYIQKYWEEILSKLDPREIYDKLNLDKIILLDNDIDSNIIASWFDLFLNEEIIEVKYSNFKIKQIIRTEYVKNQLEKCIKLTKDMHNFSSIRAMYLYEEAEELNSYMAELKKLNPNYNFDVYNQIYLGLKEDALKAEEKYKLKTKKIK